MKPETLDTAFSSACERFRKHPALVLHDRTVTFAEVANRATAAAEGLRGMAGVTPGDRVLTSMSNRPELVIAMGAAWRCGAVHVGIDHGATAAELLTAVDLLEPSALLYEALPDQDPREVMDPVRRARPDLALIAVGPPTLRGPALAWDRLQESSGLEASGTGPGPSDAALIFLSSGTTGRPKAALGYHANLASRWARLGDWLEFGPEDVHLAQLPLSHGFGLMMTMAALLKGGTVVLQPSFTGGGALELIRREGVTVMNGAPTHFRLLVKHLDPGTPAPESLRLSVGTAAAFPPDLVRSIWERLGVRFMYMYGASEGVGVATTDPEDIVLGAVGRPAAGSVAIMGPDLEPVAAGETGEIAFSRRQFPVRYWATEAVDPAIPDRPAGSFVTDDWFFSGDLGRLDEEGRLYVMGRIKHQIDRGGLKVDPVEVEAALLGLPLTADAAVTGRRNPVLGESVCAALVPVPGWTPSLAEIRRALRTTLSPHKLPDELVLLDAIPRTTLGKVDLDRLAAVLEDALDGDLVRG